MNTNLTALSDRVAYLPASFEPLSSDVGIIRGDRYCWIFDTGRCDEAANVIRGISREKNIVLSHFHGDHTDNLCRVTYKNLYCGDYTQRRLQTGAAVNEPLSFDDGVKLTIFPLPSTHSKGALGLEVNEEYAFLGDALYTAYKYGEIAYNAGRMNEMLQTLKKLKADKFLISHKRNFVQPREKIISRLEEIYKDRIPGEPYIYGSREIFS